MNKRKRYPPSEYHDPKTRLEDYLKDLENPPNPDWKPQSYEWLEEKAIDKTLWKYPPGPWEKRVVDSGEAQVYKIEAKILEILGRGICPCGHKPGDTFIFDADTIETVKTSAPAGGLCYLARCSISSFVYGMMFPGPIDYGRGEQDSFAELINCPEVQNPVIFQLKRVKKEKPYSSKAPWMPIVKKKGIDYTK